MTTQADPTKPDLYDTLHVDKTASKKDIRKNYKRMANKLHPDKPEGDIELFKQLKLAYETLYDDKARQRYDDTGDVNTGPNLYQQALAKVSESFLQVLMNNLYTLETVDIVKTVKYQIQDMRRQIATGNTKLLEKIGKLNKAGKRLHRKTKARSGPGSDILKSVIDTEIRNIKSGIVKNEEGMEVVDKMLEVIDDYDYEVDAPTLRTSPFDSEYGSTGTSGTGQGWGL